jgi:hypothetical protein
MNEEKMKNPTFIMPGAPKCGTTAMYEYLRSHPDIYFPREKEPCFFCKDVRPGIKLNDNDYAKLYRPASGYRHSGDASTAYFFSECAIPQIEAMLSAPRYIVFVRDPVELVRSLHAQRLYEGYETITDFQEAWGAQWEREAGFRRIPTGCPSKSLLMYKDIAAVGTNLQRILRYVDHDRITVFLHEDFRADPGRVYRDALAFLGLEDDGRQDFPSFNVHAERRSRSVHAVVRLAVNLRKAAGIPPFCSGLNRIYDNLNKRPGRRKQLPDEFRQELVEFFETEVGILEQAMRFDVRPKFRNFREG